MKFATLNDGSRDGRLLLVSRDLRRAVMAEAAQTLQAALDDWDFLAPQLAAQYELLQASDGATGVAFDPATCGSPLPRAFQWADGSAYVNHVELVRRARGAALPPSFWSDPLMYQGGSDSFLGPCEDIALASEDWGIDFEGEVAVIVNDVPMAATAAEAAEQILLVMLVNDVSLRGLIPAELSKGFGFFHAKPSSAFSPVAVTPDELGAAWDGKKLARPLRCSLNGALFGKPDAGQDMTFDFPTLIAHAAKTRPLAAGAIIGSGTVSNKQDTRQGSTLAEGGVGYACLAEARMIETINSGQPKTPFMRFGDDISIEMLDDQGRSIFGAIRQKVARYES
tara:strand:- start:1275 stop:2288 length:1014 start_codon:yes stop_codon:yes gene_type:complete